MRSCLPIVRGWLLLGLGIVVGVPADAWAQGQRGDMDSLLKAFDQNIPRRTQLFAGEVSPTAADKKIAQACAEWYIYRATHRTVTGDAVKLTKMYNEFNTAVATAMEKDRQTKNRAFVNLFGAALVASMNDVMIENAHKHPPTVVHAAALLPTMAKLKQDNITAYLIGLVSDPKGDDVARLYALKALKEAMPITIQLDVNSLPVGLDLTDASQNAKRSNDTKLVEALVKYIEQPRKIDDDTPYEEVEAIRFLRREAIIALAQSGSPAVLALKKPERKEGLVAPTLLRVLAAKGGLAPSPSLQEKIEAAHGLCALKYPNIKEEYEPALAVYLVGKTLDEFISAYKSDYKNFVASGKDRRLPKIAWRTEAKRWEAGLKDLALNASGTGAKGAAERLKTDATPILMKSIYSYIQPPDNLEFRNTTVPSLRPKTGYVFKSLKTPEIPLD